MVESKVNIQWPCGLKVKMEHKAGIFHSLSVHFGDRIDWLVCPLHGEYCPEKSPNGHATDEVGSKSEVREGPGLGLIYRFKRWLRGSESN